MLIDRDARERFSSADKHTAGFDQKSHRRRLFDQYATSNSTHRAPQPRVVCKLYIAGPYKHQ